MTAFTLYAFPTMPGFFNMSPYCTKAEVMLKLAGADYALEMPADHKVFPKGKLPVLKDGDTLVEDSEFIRQHLASAHGITLDDGLSAEAKATGHAVLRMLEARTSNALIWSRWIDDAGWVQTKGMFFREAPEGQADMVRGLVQARMVESDFGLHSLEEKKQLIRSDLAAVVTLLGKRDWFLSDSATYLDAGLFGMIANLYGSPIRTWTADIVGEFDALTAYFRRGMALWYPEGAKMMTAAE